MPPDSAESNSAFHPPEGGLHRSALLGQRKSRAAGLEKPPAFVRKDRPVKPASSVEPPPLAVVPEPPEVPAKPAHKPRAAKAAPAPKKPPAAKAPDAAAFQALVEEVTRLREALADRPTFSDLKALESRVQGGGRPERDSEVEHLHELLRTRQEELEELGLVVSEFQEQNEMANAQIQDLTRRLREAQLETVEAETRQQIAEGFLREALLSLLAPGDEFNEDLVEQIQHFLQP